MRSAEYKYMYIKHEAKLLSCRYFHESGHVRDHGLSDHHDHAYGLRDYAPSDYVPSGYALNDCDFSDYVPRDYALSGHDLNGCVPHDYALNDCDLHVYGHIYAFCSLCLGLISNSSYWSVHDLNHSPSLHHHDYPNHYDHGHAPIIVHASVRPLHEVYYKV